MSGIRKDLLLLLSNEESCGKNYSIHKAERFKKEIKIGFCSQYKETKYQVENNESF